MTQSRTLDVGMAVHKDSSAVAYVAHDHGAAVPSLGPIGTRPADIEHLVRTRHSKAHHLGFVDDAGPGGSGLCRDLRQKGYTCWVVAPALMPTTVGDRVTTARRDAVPLARLRRSGALTPVDGPTVDAAALRDLTRARAEASPARHAAPCRRNAFWLRHDIRDPGRATGRPAPRRWLAEVVCPTPAPPTVFHEDVRAVTAQTARRPRLAQELHEQVNTWRLPPVVEALQA